MESLAQLQSASRGLQSGPVSINDARAQAIPSTRLRANTHPSRVLDGVRFFAAVTVVAYHAATFARVHATYGHGALGALFAWAENQWVTSGYQAVMIFFVLSGYLVAGGVLRGVRAGTWSWRTYLVHRLTRLYVVLIPALGFTWLLAWMQLHLYGSEWYLRGDLSWSTLVANLLFLQKLHFSEYGGNGPLWSLSYEFWYYLLFPTIILLLKNRRQKYRDGVLYSILLLGIVAVIGHQAAMYFFIWLLGGLASALPPLRVRHGLTRFLLVTASFIICLLSVKVPYVWLGTPNPTHLSPFPQYFADLALGISFAAFVYLVSSFESKRLVVKRKPFVSVMAGFSYTLYLTHYPVLHLCFAWLSSRHWVLSEASRQGFAAGFVVVGLAVAFVVSRFTEANTGKVRRFAIRVFRLQ